MADGLVEAWRNAKKRHTLGNVTLVCLDDESLPENEYGSMGQRTIVPRAGKDGGIMGYTDAGDKKYGKGVRRREVNMDENGFIVEDEIHNFRPDMDKAEEPIITDPLEAMRDVMLGTQFNTPQPQQQQQVPMPGLNASGSNQPSEMMQMMQMFMSMMNHNGNGNGKTLPHAEPPREQPKRTDTVAVTFGGAFGRFTAQYAEARIEKTFLILAVGPDQPSTYEPPISNEVPLQITVRDRTVSALNVGLSFKYKGDIVTVMPLTGDPDDTKK